MVEGIAAGFILSLSLFPGTVWLAKVGVCGRTSQVVAVGLAFGASQLLWMVVAVPGLMMMTQHLAFMEGVMHAFAAFVLFYMGLKFFRSRRATALDDAGALASPPVLFFDAFKRSFAMPMRLPAAMAILMATGVYVNHPPVPAILPEVFAGAVVGVAWWWGQFTFLSAVFAKRVPQRVTLKSLNKIRPLCAVLFVFLAGALLFFVL
ncbi:MAG: hypothetical protein ACLFVC_00805 [Opitutales bacterium]